MQRVDRTKGEGEREDANRQPTCPAASSAPAPLAAQPLSRAHTTRWPPLCPLRPGHPDPCLVPQHASSPACADPHAPTMLYVSDPMQHFATVGTPFRSIGGPCLHPSRGTRWGFRQCGGLRGVFSYLCPGRAPAARGGVAIQGEQRQAGGAQGGGRSRAWKQVPVHPGEAQGTSVYWLGRTRRQAEEGGRVSGQGWVAAWRHGGF